MLNKIFKDKINQDDFCRNYLKGTCYRKNCPFIHSKNTAGNY